MNIPAVTKVKVLKDKKLKIQFQDGKSFVFNVKPYLSGEVFEPLKNEFYFSKVKLEDGTIRWPNEADFCPFMLYMEMKKQLKQQHSQ